MSLDRVIRALVDLGLSTSEAEIYVYIAKKGPQTVANLDKVLHYSKNQIYSGLRILLGKNLVQRFGKKIFAVSFEEALDLLITKKREKAKSISQNTKELLESWKTRNQKLCINSKFELQEKNNHRLDLRLKFSLSFLLYMFSKKTRR